MVQGESSLNVDRYFLFTIYHKNSFQYSYEIEKEEADKSNAYFTN